MFTNAKNPQWADAAHGKIILDVQFIGEEEYVPFVASADDSTTHGPMLFNFAVNGIFGTVADSDEERMLKGEIEPWKGYKVIDGVLVNVAALEREAQEELDRRLTELQSPQSLAEAECDEEYAAKRKKKLAALLAVKEQPEWTAKVEWPE